MQTLSELCLRGKFDSIWEYDAFIKKINSLIELGDITRVKIDNVNEWDCGADFFFSKNTKELFKLHHPDAPFQGAWERVYPIPKFIVIDI